MIRATNHIPLGEIFFKINRFFACNTGKHALPSTHANDERGETMFDVAKLLKAEMACTDHLNGDLPSNQLNMKLFELGFHVTVPHDDWGLCQMEIANINTRETYEIRA